MTSPIKDPDIAHDLSVICSWAGRTEIVTRVWLFGSRIRGENKPDSDLDVAIEHGIIKGDTNAYTTALCEREKWITELQPITKLELDIWSYSCLCPLSSAFMVKDLTSNQANSAKTKSRSAD